MMCLDISGMVLPVVEFGCFSTATIGIDAKLWLILSIVRFPKRVAGSENWVVNPEAFSQPQELSCRNWNDALCTPEIAY